MIKNKKCYTGLNTCLYKNNCNVRPMWLEAYSLKYNSTILHLHSLKMIILVFVFVFVNTSGLSLSAQENDWKFVKDCDGIKIYNRKTEGSPIKEIKVLNEMETTLSALVALMKDVGNHKHWAYANKKAKILKNYDEFSWIFYGYSEAPWPVQDRDMIIKSTLRQDSTTKVIHNEGYCIPDYIPRIDGVVRVPACHSQWMLEPLENGNILVCLEIQIDLGGNIPTWVINMVSNKGPYQTIKNMEEQVKKPRYKNAVLDYIIN